jgi:hypothetical protein
MKAAIAVTERNSCEETAEWLLRIRNVSPVADSQNRTVLSSEPGARKAAALKHPKLLSRAVSKPTFAFFPPLNDRHMDNFSQFL